MGEDYQHYAPHAGKIAYSIGQASVVRIPVPGTERLCIEFAPRGHVPMTGSTSTLFIQDPTGKKHLRLDYGYNVKTKTIDYHWNQKGVHKAFGITDHTPVGRAGAAAYRVAKYFRYVGRTLVVTGVALDAISVVQADRPLRRASEVVTAWAAAWIDCKAAGAGGAAIGTSVPGLGTAAGGVVGCIVGGAGGYILGENVGAGVFDWVEGTAFIRLAETKGP